MQVVVEQSSSAMWFAEDSSPENEHVTNLLEQLGSNSSLRSQIVLMIRHLVSRCQSSWPQSIPRPPPLIPTRTPVAASRAPPVRPEWLSPSSHSLASRTRSTRKHLLQARVRARAVLTVNPLQTREPRAPYRPSRRKPAAALSVPA